MSLDRQDRIDRYIRGEMPEGEMQAFERDLEKMTSCLISMRRRF